MRIFTISLIARMLLMLTVPTVVLAAEIQTNTLQNKNSALMKIENGQISNITSKKIPEHETIAQSVLRPQDPIVIKKLSAQDKRVLAYQKKLETYDPPKGKIEILVTGYSSTVDQCDGDPFTTASGTQVHKGTIACPPQYPFGTKIKVDGMGTYVCEDRGGAIKGNHFDMWFETRGEALQWGKRTVLAEIKK